MASSLHEQDLNYCRIRKITTTITFINFNHLQKLHLLGSDFVSKFPSWMTNISSLESVDLSDHRLHGPIPLDLSVLPHLKHLNLEALGQLTGNCTELLKGSWGSIESLNFWGNKLYGQLPLSICIAIHDLSSYGIVGLSETCHHVTAHPLANLRVLSRGDNDKMSGIILS